MKLDENKNQLLGLLEFYRPELFVTMVKQYGK
jgi:hypothetical protein